MKTNMFENGQTPPSEALSWFSTLSAGRLLHIVRTRWLTLLLSLSAAGGGAWFYLREAPRVYEAESLIEMSIRRPRIAGQQGAVIEDAAPAMQSDEIFNTHIQRLGGPDTRQDAVKRLAAMPSARGHAPAELAKLYEDSLQLNLVRKSRILSLTLRTTDPALARDAVNAYAAACVEQAVAENRSLSETSVAWLLEQAQTQRANLEKADTALANFRGRQNIESLETRQRTIQEALLGFNKALIDVESRRMLADDLVKTCSSLTFDPDSTGKLPTDLPRQTEIAALLERWHTLAAERDAMLLRYTPRHPEVEAREQQLASLRSQLEGSVRRAKETATSDLALLTKQSQSLREKMDEQSKAASAVELELINNRNRIVALDREREVCDTSYKGILGRIEEAKLSADENTATVKVVQDAIAPQIPVRPRPLLIAVLAAMIGIFLGVGLAILKDVAADRVVVINDVTDGAGLKVVGVIPHRRHAGDNPLVRPAGAAVDPPIGEAMAGLRGLLTTGPYSNHAHTLLITSTLPQEGKSVLAANLAQSFAAVGQKTLLVDFDLRRPRITRSFTNRSLAPTLPALWSGAGNTGLAKMVVCSPTSDLDCVVSPDGDGLHPDDVLSGDTLRRFVGWAREHYEHVIFDTPPVGVVCDALALMNLCDGVLLATRPRVSGKSATRYTAMRIADAGGPLIGVVVNDARINAKRASTGIYGVAQAYGYYAYDNRYATAAKSSRMRAAEQAVR